MGSIRRRLEHMEEDSRRRAAEEIRQRFSLLSDREIAQMIAEPEMHRDSVIEELLGAAVGVSGDPERLSRVLPEFGVFERKRGINSYLDWTGGSRSLERSTYESGAPSGSSGARVRGY